MPAITVVSREEPLPLSYAQQRLWFLSQMQGVSQAYHMPMGLRLDGVLNHQALRLALDRIVARHESLRTTFVLVDGVPVQHIADAHCGFALQEHDLRNLRLGGVLNHQALRLALDRIVARHESLRTTFVLVDGVPVQHIADAHCGFALQEHDLRNQSDAEEELERLTGEEAAAPFDLATGPLVRGCLIRMADDEHVLLVTMHHIVSDGWSQGVLINEFSALYNA
ncbi:condensation domain-containing protein, partial [Noviherbaspirillum sp. Root189]|uniref:condensation domain-containing protein n=1 Tax=Noviherbaspirillum sp. Root189 TaxID=1736487 RepID=UPI002E13D756